MIKIAIVLVNTLFPQETKKQFTNTISINYDFYYLKEKTSEVSADTTGFTVLDYAAESFINVNITDNLSNILDIKNKADFTIISSHDIYYGNRVRLSTILGSMTAPCATTYDENLVLTRVMEDDVVTMDPVSSVYLFNNSKLIEGNLDYIDFLDSSKNRYNLDAAIIPKYTCVNIADLVCNQYSAINNINFVFYPMEPMLNYLERGNTFLYVKGMTLPTSLTKSEDYIRKHILLDYVSKFGSIIGKSTCSCTKVTKDIFDANIFYIYEPKYKGEILADKLAVTKLDSLFTMYKTSDIVFDTDSEYELTLSTMSTADFRKEINAIIKDKVQLKVASLGFNTIDDLLQYYDSALAEYKNKAQYIIKFRDKLWAYYLGLPDTNQLASYRQLITYIGTL